MPMVTTPGTGQKFCKRLSGACGSRKLTAWMTAGCDAQDFHMRWFDDHMEDGVTVENVSDRITSFQISGPPAQYLIKDVSVTDVSVKAFRVLDVERLPIGQSEAVLRQVSHTGDVGFEICGYAMGSGRSDMSCGRQARPTGSGLSGCRR
jgi:glycine cleavage system aminomethyltransferase T